MLERFIQYAQTEAPAAGESAAATRERLKTRFPAGATRRMTLLGMMVGSTLPPEGPELLDAVVYSSQYGESPAMEQFLDSFPTPSPMLFQTSIHPSAPQQSLIGRGRPLCEYLPMSGAAELPFHAALAALLSPRDRVWWCGGDERGSWLREAGAASERSFAFTLVLNRESTGALGRIAVEAGDACGSLDLPGWFDLVSERRSWAGAAAPGWNLRLEWR